MKPRQFSTPQFVYVCRYVFWTQMIGAEHHLPHGAVVAPERRSDLRHSDDRTPSKVAAPRAGLDSVPPAIAPPDSPLLLLRFKRAVEVEATTCGSTGMHRNTAPRKFFGLELRRPILDNR